LYIADKVDHTDRAGDESETQHKNRISAQHAPLELE
jgi:hypothetical protein